MKLTGNNIQEEILLMALDKGIDDMENGRELPLDDEFRQEYERLKPEFDMVRALFFE